MAECSQNLLRCRRDQARTDEAFQPPDMRVNEGPVVERQIDHDKA